MVLRRSLQLTLPSTFALSHSLSLFVIHSSKHSDTGTPFTQKKMQEKYSFCHSLWGPYPHIVINNQIYPPNVLRPKQQSSLSRIKVTPVPAPALTTKSKPILTSTTLQHVKLSNKPKVSRFGPNAHLAKAFVPFSSRRSDPKSSPCSKEERKEGTTMLAFFGIV